jgi:hypothetical protein
MNFGGNFKIVEVNNNQFNKYFMEDIDDRFKKLWFYRQI